MSKDFLMAATGVTTVLLAVLLGTPPAGAEPGAARPNGYGATLERQTLFADGFESGDACPWAARSGGDQCPGGSCKDGICCDLPCSDPCFSCSVPSLEGICTLITDQDDDPECATTHSCDVNGNCLAVAGESCLSAEECLSGACADEVCCDTDCTAECTACDLLGTLGTCTPVLGQDDDPQCTDASSCDEAGVCKAKDGQPCTGGSECVSGSCPAQDGVCCDAPCDGTCESCSAADTGGDEGQCEYITAGTDPHNECTPGTFCNGAGACE